MPAGGPRTGSGRPKGSKNKPRPSTERLVEHLGMSASEFILEDLLAVVDDPAVPTDVRLEASRHLFTLYVARIFAGKRVTRW